MNTEWFAVQVWAGREQFTARQLRLRGHDVFLPSYREPRRWSDRVKQVERALFTGYVFCQLDLDSTWQLVRSPGVIRVVGDGHRPLPVPSGEITAIQRIVESQLEAAPYSFLHAGQQVRVEVGPLRGVEGIVVSARSRQRLIVSIPLLQRSVAVEMDAEWLTRVGAPTGGALRPTAAAHQPGRVA